MEKTKKKSYIRKTKAPNFKKLDFSPKNNLSFLPLLKNPDINQKQLGFFNLMIISNGLSREEEELIFDDDILDIILQNLKGDHLEIMIDTLNITNDLIFYEEPNKSNNKCQKLFEKGLFDIFDDILSRILQGLIMMEI